MRSTRGSLTASVLLPAAATTSSMHATGSSNTKQHPPISSPQAARVIISICAVKFSSAVVSFSTASFSCAVFSVLATFSGSLIWGPGKWGPRILPFLYEKLFS